MLDIGSPDFAVLPPHFDNMDERVMLIVKNYFPGALKSLESVLVHCLASLVFHREFLRRTLKADHPLFKTTLFAQQLVDKLADRMSLSFVGDKITSSGIPPHVLIQKQLETVSKIMDSIPGRVHTAISGEFE
jgi:hypothetical protein